MNVIKFLAVLLVAAGLLALTYHGFNYPKSEHDAKLGSVEFAVKSEGRTNIPEWAGVGAIVLGTLLLLIPKKL